MHFGAKCLKLTHAQNYPVIFLCLSCYCYSSQAATEITQSPPQALDKVQTTLHSLDLGSLYIDKCNIITDIFLL